MANYLIVAGAIKNLRIIFERLIWTVSLMHTFLMEDTQTHTFDEPPVK